MPKDDPELVEPVRTSLRRDGVELFERSKVVAVERAGVGVAVAIERDGQASHIEGTHLLLAAGRRPTVDGLDLEGLR